MLDITTELKDLYKTDYLPYRSEPVQKDLKFTFTDPELVIENDKVVAGSFDLQESLNSNEDLVFGSCEAATLKVKFADITQDINGKTFVLTQTVDGTEIKLGTFTVDSAIEQDNRRFLEVTAYDNMRKFDRDVVSWYEALTFPTHLKHMRESLCDYCGVEYAPLPTAQGSSIKLNSNYNSKLELLELQGKSVQNGTPTPTTPVAIQSVGDSGSVVARVCGKNICESRLPSGSINGFSYTKNSDGSYTLNGTSTQSSSFRIDQSSIWGASNLKYLSKGTYTVSCIGSVNGIELIVSHYPTYNVLARTTSTKTFTTGGLSNTFIYINVPSGITMSNVIIKPQLELGSVATTYEPYKEQLVTIPLTQPLRSVNGVYDRIVKKNGIWGVERNIGIEIFDGSADERWLREAVDSTAYRLFTFKISNTLKKIGHNNQYANIISNRYVVGTPNTTWGKHTGISSSLSDGQLYIYDPAYNTSNVSLFTAYLASNPLTVVYELATPTWEPLSQSIQDTLNKLQSYQGVTNVFTTDVLQPNMIVEYNYLPNDYMTVTKTLSTNTLNGLEVLRSLEQINGAFGHIGRDGKLQHKVLSKTVVDDTIPSGSYKKLKYEKYSTKPIDKLQINQEDGDIGAIVGTGTNCYKIQDNFLVYGKSASALQIIADNAAINILGITYVPYTCEMLGLPYLEVGDRVEFGTAITSYILSRNLKGIQSISDSLETKGNEEIVQVVSVNTEVKQLRGKTNVLTRDVEKMESTITEFDKQISVLLPGPWYPDGSLLPCQNNMTNLEYEMNSKILQTAKEITTEVNNVSEQLNSQISQTAASITAQVNNLSANMSAQFAITDAEISTKVEKNGIISSINQSAESVTINANKINLTGYATFSGLSDGTTVINGGCIKTGQIDAERIKAGTLNGMTLTGAYINCFSLISESSSSNSSKVTTGYIEVTTSGKLTEITGNYIRVNGTSVALNGHGHFTTEIYASLYNSPTYPGTYYAEFSNTSGDTNIPTIGWVKARQASDKRLKKNIKLLDVEDEYMELKPVEYKYRKHVNNSKVHFGFVANDIAESFDKDKYNIVEYDTEIITEGERKYVKDGVYRINYEDMHAMHVAMIQKHQLDINMFREELRECKELIHQYCN